MIQIVSFVMNRLAAAREEDRGATMVEYGILVALIAAIAILVVTALGLDVLEGFNAIEDNLFGNDA
jgi:pilus assembly protein Flp/PilA